MDYLNGTRTRFDGENWVCDCATALRSPLHNDVACLCVCVRRALQVRSASGHFQVQKTEFIDKDVVSSAGAPGLYAN